MTEQDSQSSAVLRREAEQLLAQTGGTYSNQGQSVTFDVRPLLREVEVFLEAFARRQRAQALKAALVQLEIDMEQPGFVDAVEWLRARAAAEGTET